MTGKNVCKFLTSKPEYTERSLKLVIVILLVALVVVSLALFFVVGQTGIGGASGEVKAAIAGQMYQILFLLIVLGASVGAFAYWVMHNDLTSGVQKTVDEARKQILKEADDHITRSGRLSEARAYIGMSHAIFRSYFEAYDEFVASAKADLGRSGDVQGEPAHKTGQTDPTNQNPTKIWLRREIAMGKEIAYRGVRLFEDEPLKNLIANYGSQAHGEGVAFERWVVLLGHLAYHYAADRIVENQGQFVIDEENEGYRYARECARQAKVSLDWTQASCHPNDWWETLENCGLCLALSPWPEERAEGKGILIRLITNSYKLGGEGVQFPGTEWRYGLWEEYNDPLDLELDAPDSTGDNLERESTSPSRESSSTTG